MMKKLFPLLLVLTLIFGTMGSVMAKGSSKGSFSGGSRSYSTHSYSSGSTYNSGNSGNKTYSSGVRRPSSGVNRPSSSYQPSYTQPRTSSWGSFFGGMAAGSLLTSMFHPFGGGHYYGGYGSGYGGGGFSFFGLLFDLLLIYIVYRIVRRLFFRR